MAEFLTQATGKIKAFWSRISFSQRVVVGVIATALIGAFFLMMLLLNRTEMTALYSNLNPEDANRVIQALEAEKVKYELAEGGKTILVPADSVHQQRIKIAGEGTLMGQGIGFEAFDQIQVGETDFAQKIKYQRALQGELARTIAEFPAVESARVHLVIPQRSLFIEEQKKPSASVTLRLKDGKRLNNSEVLSIVNLISMSVEGLTRERIAVTDAAGKTLFQPDEEGSLTGLTNTQFEHRQLVQSNLERKIEELLTPYIGVGRLSVKVNADLDFNQKTISRELYDPDVTVVRSETRSESSTEGQANLEAGVPDVNFRGDGLTGSVSTQRSNSEQRATNYEINKEVQNIVGSVGEINRLSVAVLVDGHYTTGENGESVYTARSAEELRAIRQQVASAVGFSSARGDVIEVSSVPFGIIEIDEPQDLAGIIADYAIRIGKPFLNAALIFLFLLIVVRPVVMALIRPKVEGEMLEELAGLPMGEERLALTEGSDEELDAMAILEKIEDIKAHALHLSEQNMDQAIGIIRSWLKGEEVAGTAKAA